ncbi:MAG: hypothetical protein WAZ98_13775 [Cyclobacteriaceae bacterium]
MNRLLSCALLMVVFSCGNPLPAFDNLNLIEWKDDKGACRTYRSQHIEDIRSQKEKLLSLKESQVISLLGRPDRNELYKRNQKFYQFYLEPGPGCADPKVGALKLVIRFNAMGLAKEVAIE